MRSLPHSCSVQTLTRNKTKPMSDELTLNDNEANVTRIVRAVRLNGKPMIVQAEYCEGMGIDIDSLNIFPLLGDKVGERLPLGEKSKYLTALWLHKFLTKMS